MFVAAFGLGIYYVAKPPMEFHGVRQYHSAILARGFYETPPPFEGPAVVPPDGIIEPPILEFAASVAYRALGGEHFWAPRLLSAAFWTVGGVFLYLIARKLVSVSAAIFSTFFYLFVPFGIMASKAFMPDPLMVMMLLISIFTILRYYEHPSTRGLLVAALASSLAILIKPGVCFFQIFGAFVSLTIYREGLRKSLTSFHLLAFSVLSLFPTTLYYIYGALGEGFLQGQIQNKIMPNLLFRWSFWNWWLFQIQVVVGYVALLGALFGALLFRSGLHRALMLGLWGGYFLFGLVFSHHVSTHDYYSLQLIPVVALSLSPVAALVASALRRVDLRYYERAVPVGLLLLAMLLSAYEHRTELLLIKEQFEKDSYVAKDYWGWTVATDYQDLEKTYEEIGEAVGHSSRTLFLVPDEGFPLIYYGRVSGTWFPPPGEEQEPFWASRQAQANTDQVSAKERFEIMYSELSPEYFIVITPFNQWGTSVNFLEEEKYQDLRKLLGKDFSIVAQGEGYVVFDLRQ